jgi:two-component system response regulator GlrR
MEKILVVDDDPSILKVIRMRLEAQGYRVTTAADAQEAVKLVSNDIFDVALVDLKLNGKNGIELMEDLRQMNPEMPVIILTAYGTIKSAVDAMKKGAYSYLTKPFDHEELLLQIQNCLERNRLTQEVKHLKNLVGNAMVLKTLLPKAM